MRGGGVSSGPLWLLAVALTAGLPLFAPVGPAAGADAELGPVSPKSETKEAIGDSLVIRLGAEPGTLNPILATDAYASDVLGFVGESLLKRNMDTLELEPELAESWEESADHLTFVFRLRRNVQWHDGTPFTAEDVRYSFERILDPAVDAAHLRNYYQDVEAVEALDSWTVRFRYRRPYFRALEICGTIPLVPAHAYREGDFNRHPQNRSPLGTGPYRFATWETGRQIVLERFPGYWGGPVFLDRIVFRILTDSTVALQILKKRELDWMGLTPLQWLRQTVSNRFEERFAKIRFFEPYYSYIGWNAHRPWFGDRRVRTALTLLVDRQKILDRLLFGMGIVVSGSAYVNSPEYDPSVEPLPYDPSRAKNLLAEAGWQDSDGDGVLDREGISFQFEFLISAGSVFAEQLATILKEDLFRTGIRMQIRKLEWAVFIQQIQERKFDAVTLGWSLSVESDPYQLWHSSQASEGSNFVGFSHPEADRIIEEARATFDKQKRIALYHRFHRILHEEQPYTFLFCTERLMALDRRFHNVQVHRLGLYPREWFVPIDLQRYP